MSQSLEGVEMDTLLKQEPVADLRDNLAEDE
jgi:hypothetical protein